VIGGSTDELRCSRAGCRADAAWSVNWRNPRIHTADRVKVWLACDEHGEYLRDYLGSRGFPVLVTPLGVAAAAHELDGPGAAPLAADAHHASAGTGQ
jgi:hypothetical protein